MVIAMRAGPLGYIHTYVAGALTARIFILSSMKDAQTDGPVQPSSNQLSLDTQNAPRLFKFGCFFGYALYSVMVFVLGNQVSHFYMIFHNGGMIPIMGLLVLGAATGVDPITEWLFKSRPFIMLGRISYIQYLMQRSVWVFLNTHFEENLVNVLYPFALIGFAYILQATFEAPYTEWQRLTADKVGLVGRAIEQLDQLIVATKARRALLALFMVTVVAETFLSIIFAAGTQ